MAHISFFSFSFFLEKKGGGGGGPSPPYFKTSSKTQNHKIGEGP